MRRKLALFPARRFVGCHFAGKTTERYQHFSQKYRRVMTSLGSKLNLKQRGSLLLSVLIVVL